MYNPKLVEEILGEKVADLMDGTVEIINSEQELLKYSNLKVGDTLVFRFKEVNPQQRHFIVTSNND